MIKNHIAYVALAFSYIFGILALVLLFIPYSSFNSKKRSYRKYWSMLSFFGSTLLMLLAYLIGANAFDSNVCGGFTKGWTELISGTLGFFSLDADYTQFIRCAQAAFCGRGVFFFYIEYCIYVLLAPVIGGAFILNIITEFLPALKLWLDCKKTKYVFSELNERSITLAESIAKLSWELNRWHMGKDKKEFKEAFDKIGIEPNEKKWLKSACIVFTDAYADKQVENSSELLTRAQRIGAICLKDDILERPFRWYWWRRSRKLVYFLMDSNEENNVTTAISLLSAEPSKKLQKKTEGKSNLWSNAIRKRKIAIITKNDDAKKKENEYTAKRQVEIYVFTQSSESARLIDKAKDEFNETIKNAFVDKAKCRSANKARNELVKKLKKASQNNPGEYRALKKNLQIKFNLRVKCINEYRNLVYKMFDDRELLDAFVSQVGNTPVPPNNVSLEKHDVYRVWHHYFENTSTDDSTHTIGVVILGAGRLAKEYIKAAAWCYKMCSDVNECRTDNVEISVFAQNATELQNQLLLEAKELLKCDCKANFFDADFPSANFFDKFQAEVNLKKRPVQKVLVALGDDHLNYDAACWIKARFEQQLGINAANIQPVVIDFAVENNDLCKVLHNEFNADNDKNDWCILRPFSTLKDCFSYSSIRMDDLEKRGLEADRLHEKEKEKEKNESEYFNGNYNWKSSIAVALHTVYKWFSQAKIGVDVGSLYKLMLNVAAKKQININKRADIQRQIENKIYWLEHMRWIAYMHTEGYRCPTAKEFTNMAFDSSCSYIEEHQKDDLRHLHACILFSDDKHTDKKELVKKFYDYSLKNSNSVKVKKTLKSYGKDEFVQQLVDKAKKTILQIKTEKPQEKDLQFIAEAVAALKIKIKQMQEDQADRPLSEWLEDIVLPEDNEIDNLDRLNLLVTLTTTPKSIETTEPPNPTTEPTIEPTDFKDYDIELSRGLCLQILKLQIEKYFDEKNYNDNTKFTLENAMNLYSKTNQDKCLKLLKALAEQKYHKYIKRGNSTIKTKELLDCSVKFLTDQENAKKISISDNLELVRIADLNKKITSKHQYIYTSTDKLISWTFRKINKKKGEEKCINPNQLTHKTLL